MINRDVEQFIQLCMDVHEELMRDGQEALLDDSEAIDSDDIAEEFKHLFDDR